MAHLSWQRLIFSTKGSKADIPDIPSSKMLGLYAKDHLFESLTASFVCPMSISSCIDMEFIHDRATTFTTYYKQK